MTFAKTFLFAKNMIDSYYQKELIFVFFGVRYNCEKDSNTCIMKGEIYGLYYHSCR